MTNLVVQYTFGSSSYTSPNTIINVSNSTNAILYNATIINNVSINENGYNDNSSSALFNASQNQYISIPSINVLSTGLSFTFWFKSNNSGDWARIFDFGNGPGPNNILAAILSNNMAFYISNNNNVTQQYDVISNINNNIWYHVSWTISTSGLWSIYLNGNLVNTFSEQYPAQIFTNLNYIGKSNWDGNPYFNGNIADFRIYNSVLSNADVSSIYSTSLKSSSIPEKNIDILSTGYNNLYNQIYCNLYPTTNGFSTCQDCNFENIISYNKTPNNIANSESECLNSCNTDPVCTSYSYNRSTKICNKYDTFPERINVSTGTNSGYSLTKYTYPYTSLPEDKQTNIKERCISQFLDNSYSRKNIDTSSCNTMSVVSVPHVVEVPSSNGGGFFQQAINDIENAFGFGNNNNNETTETTYTYYTNISSDPKCIYDLYKSNNIPINNNSQYIFNGNSQYDLSSKSDTNINNYGMKYSKYNLKKDNIKKVVNKNIENPSSEDIKYNAELKQKAKSSYNLFKQSIDGSVSADNIVILESFKNNSINSNNIFFIILILIVLSIFLYYIYKK